MMKGRSGVSARSSPRSGLAQLGRDRGEEVTPDQGLGLDPEQARMGSVREDEAEVRVIARDQLGLVLDDGAVPALAVLQRLLGAAALADVAQVGGEQAPVREAHLGDRELDRKHGAVGMQAVDLDAAAQDTALARREVACHALGMALAQVGRNDQLGDRSAERLAAAKAEGVLGSFVELQDPPRLIRRDDAVECGLEHGRLARLLVARMGEMPAAGAEGLVDGGEPWAPDFRHAGGDGSSAPLL